ncbi:MAG TPA: DUF5069 domain-containing protein [Candidatus Eremiobacteraceae bacterium]|nr:DUF5069 domain-containing protein [Candidatus Eremiobacteraceae bacterium]
MDLTTSVPRSVKDTSLGSIVMLARTTDKARASAAGTVGEYHYNCSMDQKVLAFVGVDHEEFAKLASRNDDAKLVAILRERYLKSKTAADINSFNEDYLKISPEPGSDSEKFFLDLRTRLAPNRTDVTTWPDLLDLDEGREVPLRRAA